MTSEIESFNPVNCRVVWLLQCVFGSWSVSFMIYVCVVVVVVCVYIRSGFSQPGQRSLLKKALGVLAGRLKEGGAELTLEQLVK